MNKRLLGGLLAAGIVGGGVYGFAATLTVTPGDLSAGNETVFSCDTDGVGTSYTTAWNDTANRYEVASVTVTGIAATCEDADISVTLVDSTGAQTGPDIAADTVDGTSTLFDGLTGASAAAVVGVHVVIDF